MSKTKSLWVATVMLTFILGMATSKLVIPRPIDWRLQTDTVVLSQIEFRDYVVTHEAQRAQVPIQMALAVSRAENWSGDPEAISSAGAVGVMQIMPDIWGDRFMDECYGGRDLTDVWRNACLGVRILAFYYEGAGNWDSALRLYNGSDRYKNLGDQYVTSVMSRLDFAEEELDGSDE